MSISTRSISKSERPIPLHRALPGPLLFGLRLFLVLSSVAGGLPAQTEPTEASAERVKIDPVRFPVPEVLEPNVSFWKKVYTAYDSHHVIVHDNRHLNVIYAVVDFTELDEKETSEIRRRQKRRQEIREVIAKYRTVLNHLAAGKSSSKYADEEARVARLFEKVPGKGRSKYAHAVRRIRTQTAIRDRFAEGIERSGLHLARIEEVFKKRGLPRELTRLPLVESLFQIRAHSSASAVGIWQFVRGTARLYLDMELEFDNRYDPLRASEGAAKFLSDNYASLKTWPLAITAYNHGAGGMRRAVRLLGTRDFGEIATRYRSKTFGFASRNFYSEFVAAFEVYENRAHYFPEVEPFPAWDYEIFEPEHYVAVAKLTKKTSASLEDLREMNPALNRQIWSDDLYVPAKYRLRVPRGTADEFQTAYRGLADHLKSSHQVGLYYRVKRGDTLSKIAAKYGTSSRALQRANNLRSAHLIRAGQSLLIPPSGGATPRARTTTTATAIAAGPRPSSHVVRKGETLTAIARRYGVSLASLRSANRLADVDRIHVGQRLNIPSADTQIHVVRRGDTLAKIAQRYGTSVRAIKDVNGLRSDVIQPSQVLKIP